MPVSSTHLRRDLREHLAVAVELAGLVGTRIHHARVPVASSFPALVYQVTDVVEDKDLDGPCGTGTCTLALEAWGESYGSAEAVMIAALGAFPQDLTRLFGGRKLLFVSHPGNSDEIPAEAEDGSDDAYFGQSARIRIGFYES
jgi:hypothetical protein